MEHMKHARWWVVFYGDGSTFDSRAGGPDAAPARDVQMIYQHRPRDGQQKLAGVHWYVWRDGRWDGLETVDAIWDYLWSPGWKRVLSGRRIDSDTLNQISASAHRYCRFAEKRATAPWEPDK